MQLVRGALNESSIVVSRQEYNDNMLIYGEYFVGTLIE